MIIAVICLTFVDFYWLYLEKEIWIWLNVWKVGERFDTILFVLIFLWRIGDVLFSNFISFEYLVFLKHFAKDLRIVYDTIHWNDIFVAIYFAYFIYLLFLEYQVWVLGIKQRQLSIYKFTENVCSFKEYFLRFYLSV